MFRRMRRLRRSARRAIRVWRAAPLAVQVLSAALAGLFGFLGVNWAVQAVRKPTEMFFPVSGALTKTPRETWRSYQPLFREHSTAVVTPALLAALAQLEAAGNPVARTYWRWRLTWNLFEIYRPASSAVGMYQITDATFREARRYCIHDHAVAEDGPWYDFDSCWFNSLYARVLPSHAVEMTAAFLDRSLAATLRRRKIDGATLSQKQNLAAIIHLCGSGAGDAYARRGFRLLPGQRCGDHDAARFLAQIEAMKRHFAHLAEE
ncbi:MAG: hypothetical protein WBO23_08680 [Burkholderiales bacterium]